MVDRLVFPPPQLCLRCRTQVSLFLVLTKLAPVVMLDGKKNRRHPVSIDRQTIGKAIHTFIILGRLANLPTVWSNCLAGWWLGGASSLRSLAALCCAASFLYLGGMFLNDACDASYDAEFQRTRPVPSGAIELRTLWLLSLVWIGLGLFILACYGTVTALLALGLAGIIMVYNALNKVLKYTRLLLALGRFLIYLVAASTAFNGVTGLTVWSALALAPYVAAVQLMILAKPPERLVSKWIVSLLVAPVILALLVNTHIYQIRAVFGIMLLILWVLNCLRYSFWSFSGNVKHTASGLTAGIVVVDYLAVGPDHLGLFFAFLPLFLATLLLQRIYPRICTPV
jgi:hypothetical protein